MSRSARSKRDRHSRSRDLGYFKFAEAATRMMSDVAFVHYVSDDVREQFADQPERMMWDAKQPYREIGERAQPR